jgi:hypothetical protein
MTFNLPSSPPHPASLGSLRRGRVGAFAAEAGAPAQVAQATAPLLLMVFVISILPPVYFHIGETRLSLTRIFLLLTFLPLGFRLLSGKAGPLRAIDIFLILFSVWMAVTILLHQGLSRIPLAGISVVEFLGGYLIGRTLITNATDYRLFLFYLFWAQLFLMPFSLLEFFTNVNLLHDFFGLVFETFKKVPSQTWRNGFARVISGFEHPILYGLFCSIMVAPFFYLYRDRPVKALSFAALPIGMTYMSLSSAPLIGIGLCALLIAWDCATRSNWKPLLWIVCLVYVFLSIASNRGPVIILIDTLTFDPHTAWTRIWTFRYGSTEVMQNPIFGIGFTNDWPRPSWLTPSVDNFWLLIAMRHGLTGFILLGLALGTGLWAILRVKILNHTLALWRTGYVIALVGLYFSLATVHIWGDTSSLIMCFIGAGMWLCTAEATVRGQVTSVLEPPSQGKRTRALPTTRFGQNYAPSTISHRVTKH